MTLATLIIRRAEAKDTADIAEIYNAGILSRQATFEIELRTAEHIAEWLAPQQTKIVLVAAEAETGAVAGWASVSGYRPRECYQGIGEYSVYVAPSAQGQGVGLLLLPKLIETAQNAGYWKLVSRIFPENIASLKLCARCGFREVGVYYKHAKLDGKWRDVVIVERLMEANLT